MMCVFHGMSYAFLILVFRLGNSGSFALTTNLSTLAYEMCANNHFCKSGSDTLPDGEYSCCEDCSCEDDCYIGQHCCPDAAVHNTMNISLTCKDMDKLFNSYRNISIRLGTITKNYYTVDYCREDFSDADVIAGCLNPKDLPEHVFVTDPTSSIIYKNFQCAICNGVHYFESWNLKLSCLYGDGLYSAPEQEEFILDNCRFNPEPTESSESLNDKWLCYPDAIDTCNVTGGWNDYDRSLVDACSTFNIPYTEKIYKPNTGRLIGLQRYKNVFCFLCNKKRETVSNQICPRPFDDNDDKNRPMAPFEALIKGHDVASIANIDQEGQNVCQINEMPDAVMGCPNMFCPFGSVPTYGKCLSRMINKVITFAAAFELEFTVLNSSAEPIADGKIYDILLEKLDEIWTRSTCGYCVLEAYAGMFYIEARSSEKCPFARLLKLFEYISRMERIRGETGSGPVEFRIWLSAKYSRTEEPNRINMRKLVRFQRRYVKPCSDVAFLSPKFYCRRIKFTMYDLDNKSKLTNDTIARLLAKSESDYHINDAAMHYVVCVDDYIGVVNAGARPQYDQCILFAWSLCCFALTIYLF